MKSEITSVLVQVLVSDILLFIPLFCFVLEKEIQTNKLTKTQKTKKPTGRKKNLKNSAYSCRWLNSTPPPPQYLSLL